MSSNQLPSFRFFKLSAPAPYVIHVEINRPEKLNAFCHPMWFELKAVFDFLGPNPDVRCILLSGAGDRAFTAGMALQALTLDLGRVPELMCVQDLMYKTHQRMGHWPREAFQILQGRR